MHTQKATILEIEKDKQGYIYITAYNPKIGEFTMEYNKFGMPGDLIFARHLDKISVQYDKATNKYMLKKVFDEDIHQRKKAKVIDVNVDDGVCYIEAQNKAWGNFVIKYNPETEIYQTNGINHYRIYPIPVKSLVAGDILVVNGMKPKPKTPVCEYEILAYEPGAKKLSPRLDANMIYEEVNSLLTKVNQIIAKNKGQKTL